MKIKWISEKKEYWITDFVTTVTWSGADTQASRSLEFELVNTPFDKSTKIPVLKGGDIVIFYDDDEKRDSRAVSPGKTRFPKWARGHIQPATTCTI